MHDVFMTSTISLRVTSTSMSSDEIASGLPWVPQRKWSIGEARMSPSGAPSGGTRDHTYATFCLTEKRREWLSSVLAECIAMVDPYRSFLEKIRASGGRTELFVGWFLERGGGDVLPHRLLLQMAELGLDLSLDIYPEENGCSDTHD